ncbi:AbrB family transcriptional regulator [Pimelobacter simplex]|uniref:AbrB family transcriptional regulator n=1 Tax=Nocardioides simplex TaxID=2045 RepID=A0A7J5E289_NOCSI|nr:AbrB family transcriptional regulator [Pimelobacter simplex]KAB2812375.1 AbrB family transcriptional regulator [Pimelobacter simplex]
MTVRLGLAAAATYAVVVAGLAWVGAPSPPLFAAMVAAVVVALRAPEPPPMPPRLRALGMAVVGTAAGASVDVAVLRTVAREPVAVVGGVVATLLVSMLIGQLLRLSRHVDGTTAVFASIAGGASGVALAAREYGADDAIVISVQYLRVVLVLISVPLVAPLLGDAGGAGGAATGAAPGAAADPWSALLYTACSVVGGLVLARLVPISAAPIIGTLLASSALSLSGLFADARVPAAVVAVGFTIVGANVGLSLTLDRLRKLVRLFPLALAQVVLSVGACAVVGVLFADAVGISRIDGYLATTPGGLPAVVAVAVDSGDAIGLILTMQFVRVFVALALAPAIGAVLRRRGRGRGERPRPEE